MDQAPKLPPRPEKSANLTALQRHHALMSRVARQADQSLLTQVPPPPTPSADATPTVGTPTVDLRGFTLVTLPNSSQASTSSSHASSKATTSHLKVASSSSSSSTSSASPSPTLNPVPLSPSRVPSAVFSSFQENVLYSMEQPEVQSLSKSNGGLQKTSQAVVTLNPPSTSAKRPTRIAPNSPPSGSALIDLNNSLNNGSQNNGLMDEEALRREKARQFIKSMVSQSGHSVPGTPLQTLTSPLGVPINVPSMSPFNISQQSATLPLGIHFTANPLYSNQMMAGSFGPNGQLVGSPTRTYANLINNNNNNRSKSVVAVNHLYFNSQQGPQQAYVNWGTQPASFASSSPPSAFASPVHSYSSIYSSTSTNYQDPQAMYMNEVILNKINNNSSQQASPSKGVALSSETAFSPGQKPVLTPTSIFDIRKYTTSQSVIDLFDPLAKSLEAEGSPVYARATESPIPPPPEKSDEVEKRMKNLGEVVEEVSDDTDSDATNNNGNKNYDASEGEEGCSSNRHSGYTNLNDEPINLLYVEERTTRRYSPDLEEFCDHLKALYLTVGTSKSSSSTRHNLSNSGLVWSPRIDISREDTPGSRGGSFSVDMYMCSPATKKQLAMMNSSLNSSLSSNTSGNINESESELSDRSAIFDVKFNALVFAKLAGAVEKSTSSGSEGASVTWHSKKLTCALDNVVDIIIYNLATHYGGSEGAEVNYEDFLLKINGRNEYLVPKSSLSSYVYIQTCKKKNADIHLELVDQTAPEFWRPFLRSEADADFITNARTFTPEALLPSDSVNAFVPTNANALNRLLEKLNLSVASFLSLPSIDAVKGPEGVGLFRELTGQVQCLVSALSHLLTSRLWAAIDRIQKYYHKHISDYGTGSGGVLSSKELMATFENYFGELLRAFAEVLYIYSSAFPVDFALPLKHTPKLPEKKEEITRQVESFKLKLDVVCQVASEWKSPHYGSYCLRVVLAHGFTVLEYKYTKRLTLDGEHGRLAFDQRELVFDTIIANLPRETRVDFQLMGIKGGGGAIVNGAPVSSKVEVDILAGTFFYLFEHENVDERHLYRIGQHLLPMTPLKPPISLSTISSTSINSYEQLEHAHRPVISDANYLVGYHLDPAAPMLVFSIRQNKPAVQYFYPKVAGPCRVSQAPETPTPFSRTTFDRASLRLDTRVPLTERSDSMISNGSSVGGGYHDSLYGFYGRSTECLEPSERSKIISIVQRNPLEPLSDQERTLLWKNADALAKFPSAILKLLKAPKWSHSDLKRTYQLLDSFDYFTLSESTSSPPGSVSPSAKMSRSMSFDCGSSQVGGGSSSTKQLPFLTPIEALQLLAADYPDQKVRQKAVRWLKTVSADELCDFLPQLVQSLRYEPHLDCSLIWLLYECALTSARFCHHLYWLLQSCKGDDRFGARATFYLNGLLVLCGGRVRTMFERQESLCTRLEAICEEIKSCKESTRATVLRQRLEAVHEFLECCPISIPLSPSIQVRGLEIAQCSYFNSNSLPLKIVFHSAPPYCTSAAQLADAVVPTRPNLMAAIYEQRRQLSKVIFKSGDDLRQDMLVMQIISIINRMWLRAGLDLRLITFGVINNAHRSGMIELVSRSRTLRQIQVDKHGVTGNFKTSTIAEWLKRENPSEFEYKMACENFVHSCAGYVVITYLLGICDRHNDNIMVTTSGHLFHIDFGKFLGDAQTMAGFIKRDRVPFVFTADMAYVINEGDKQSKSYQYFVDLCLRCFSQVRANGNFLLSLLAMMIPSGIYGLTPETIKYFHNALMPEKTDSQAQEAFYQLIKKALGSYATQFNFLLHNFAQLRFSGGGGNSASLSNSQMSDSQLYYAVPGGNGVNGGANGSSSTTGDGANDGAGLGQLDSDLTSLESEAHGYAACRFSFSSKRFTRQAEGEITRLEIVDIWKRPAGLDDGREYLYKVLVHRATVPETLVYRSYREFCELHEKMTRIYTLVRFAPLGGRKKPTTAAAADGAKAEVQTFLNHLLSLAHEISHSDVVYSFFHTYHRDQNYLDVERASLGGASFSGSAISTLVSASELSGTVSSLASSSVRGPLQPGKIKLAINFADRRLNVLVMYGRNLATERNGSSPDTYVKLYLVPDSEKRTKRKTKVVSKNANPTYMESIAYDMVDLGELRTKRLEVSVWANDIAGNSRIGATMVDLAALDLESKTEKWYKLFSAGAQN